MKTTEPTAAEITEAALKLSFEQRLELAEKLHGSLHPPGNTQGREAWIASWRPEWDRRVKAARDGTEPAIPFEEAWREIAGLDE